MAALSTHTNASTALGPPGSLRPLGQTSSTYLTHEEGPTSSTPADRLLEDSSLSSDAASAGATNKVGKKLSRTDSRPSGRLGTRASHQRLTKSARARDFRQRIIATRHSVQEWIRQQKWWPWEVGCWLSSLALLLAVIAVLSAFEGKTSPHWKFGITVNALVSVFATVNVLLLTIVVGAGMGQLKWIWFRRHARSLADFDILDQASKGPTGSLMLLLRWRGG